MATSEPTLPESLLGSIPWGILIFLIIILLTYLADCYVLQVSTQIVVDDKKRKCEETNRLLLFQKGPVGFTIGSYRTGRPIEERSGSVLGEGTAKEGGA